MKTRSSIISLALWCAWGPATAAPLPTANCKALTVDAAKRSLAVRSGTGTLLWSVQAALAPEAPASLSRDARKVAFASDAQPPQIVVAGPDKRITADMPAPSDMVQLNAVEWLPGDRLKVRWDGHLASFLFSRLTGWPAAPLLKPEGDFFAGVRDCMALIEGGSPLCSGDFELTVEDSPVARFDHSTAASQPRTSFSQAFVRAGSTVPVPGAPGIRFHVSAIANRKADIQLIDDSVGATKTTVESGTEIEYPTPSGVHLFHTDSVQDSGVTQSFIAMDGGLLKFNSLVSLGAGTIGVVVSSDNNDSFLEVWQKVGASYAKRSRTAMPRSADTLRLEASQASVLAVHDASGFYEVPFTLSYSGNAVTRLTFGEIVTRPSSLAGQRVLEWNCN